ncbi:MAG: flavin monoamine oxidase family protein [Roseobacter sp.]
MRRRNVLMGLAASGVVPKTVRSQHSSVDVVIIGAGIAGLQAARTLIAAGRSVLVLEAANRIGGRAFTGNTSQGQPFDLGCSWINADNNPFLRISNELGMETLRQSSAGEALFVGSKRANSTQRAAYHKAWGAVERGFERAGEDERDIAASQIVPEGLAFGATVQTWIGPMDHGVDFDDLSVLDYWEAAEGQPSYIVRGGLGAVVAHWGADVPVALNTRATGVNWGGKEVAVHTDNGSINASACIVTVSTGVLENGAIAFSPELPNAAQGAITDLPMGLLCKIALQFDGARFGFVPNQWLTHHVTGDVPGEACFFLTWPFDFDYSVGFIGGAFGWELARAGDAATVDFALNKFVEMAGSDARKHFVGSKVSTWANNPNTLGAYAAARPGSYDARSVLAQPIADRLFFAGEAVAGPYAALCSGAYYSGEEQALAVLKALR